MVAIGSVFCGAMRRFIYCFLLLATITISCHKSHPDANFFQLKINATTYTFDSLSAIVDTSVGVWATSVFAYNTKTGSITRFHTQSDLKKFNGTYSRNSPTPANFLLLDFGANILPNTPMGADAYTLEGTTFTLTINSSDNNYITGSFSGSVTDLNHFSLLICFS